MGEEGGDKTEEPTPHRLREAREKGQIAKSKEVTTAILLLLSYVVFRYTGDFSWGQIVEMSQGLFLQIPASANEFSFSFAAYALAIGLKGLALAIFPLILVTFIAAIVSESFQTGFVFALDPLSPKIERLNPIEGFKK